VALRVDTAELEHLIERETGVSAAVEIDGEDVVISGLVQTEGARDAALEVARGYVPDANVVDDLEVEAVMPEDLDGLEVSDADAAGFQGSEPGTSDDEAIEAGDFTDQRILNDPWGAAGPSGTTSDEDISEGEEDYVPPTDPPSTREGEFLGGFQTTAMDDDNEINRGVLHGIADEALVEAIQLELREDSSTTAFALEVTVEQGVATLRGEVEDLEDDENALAVAARVPGVLDVQDHLRVRNLQ
jgi:osmotically-inducible protein OsmY